VTSYVTLSVAALIYINHEVVHPIAASVSSLVPYRPIAEEILWTGILVAK